jgi:sialidase-1
MRKAENILIYGDDEYYATFPSIVARPDGELLVAFRRAPDRRRQFGEGHTHADPNSHLVLVRSRDLGRTWSRDPELIYAHPMGGSQDPCMVQLDDGSLLVTSYAWMLLPQESVNRAKPFLKPFPYGWTFAFLGGYLMRSVDAGRTWSGPIVPPQLAGQVRPFPGISIPAHQRGAMVQGRDGVLYWISQLATKESQGRTGLGFLTSNDRGLTWKDRGKVAADKKVVFNETSLVETERGDLVAFVRTGNFDDHGVVVRSTDHGKTWKKWQDMGIVGHPYHALRLPDGRFYLVYGYRHPPFGIRARIIDPECRKFDGPELVLRKDGGGSDLGYPWSCLAPDGRVLSVYYFNKDDGTRHIAGTFVEV